MSWETLAAQFDVSRQAMHRRLAGVAEWEFADAQKRDSSERGRANMNLSMIADVVDGATHERLQAQAVRRARELAQARSLTRWWEY
jgi:hypothetical protein